MKMKTHAFFSSFCCFLLLVPVEPELFVSILLRVDMLESRWILYSLVLASETAG